jgi:two-component system, NtrC family, sensor histidine kinase PilS
MGATLERQLKVLMLLRVVMITTLLLVAIYIEAVSDILLRINALYHLIVATYVVTIVYILALRYWKRLAVQVYIQVVLDLVVITGIVYIMPGEAVRGGFLLLYPLSVLSGSVLLDRRQGLLLAGLATIFYAALLWAVREGHIEDPRGMTDVPFLPLPRILYAILLTGVACATVSMVGGYFAQALKKVGAQLEEVSEQVADLQQLNEMIVESMQSGLLMVDSLARVLYVNRYGESVLGQPTAEIRGRTLLDVFGASALDSTVLAAYAHGTLGRVETSYRRPGGVAVDLGVSVMPLAKGGGHLLVFQDLTEVKRLEREVRVKEKLAAVGEMAAQLAHEIRNPLGAISGSAQVLMAEPNMTDEQGRLLGIITRESKRLSEALNQYLGQARPGPLLGRPVDLGPLIDEAVALLRNGPEVGPDHRVEFERDIGSHVCVADPARIVQIFWNLARNGLEAMPDGGALHVRLIRRTDAVILSIRDHGTGIAGDDPRRLFEPFQAHSRVGTGLGLAIVYGIVKEHRGDIRVRTVPGEGTEFEVHLPAAVPARAGDSAGPA